VGRSALYQSGGAFGFSRPAPGRDGAGLRAARSASRADRAARGHQFVEGDVLHWWHPPADRGTRTRFADDLLWLPYVTAFYARTTGDDGVLDEEVGFVTARALEPGEDEAYLQASPSEERASVYEHCCRAIDRSLATGPHDLPLMGTGDWNDGMNRVGREGRGESVWMGWFSATFWPAFMPFCTAQGDGLRARRYSAHRTKLAEGARKRRLGRRLVSACLLRRRHAARLVDERGVQDRRDRAGVGRHLRRRTARARRAGDGVGASRCSSTRAPA
jgi:cyclic beta-1,2-glucan synthetase